MEFKVGQTVKCCGGDDGLILAITEKRVLVAVAVPSYEMVKLVVGSDQHEYDGELVWSHGHYYHSGNKFGCPEAIRDAWEDWNERH